MILFLSSAAMECYEYRLLLTQALSNKMTIIVYKYKLLICVNYSSVELLTSAYYSLQLGFALVKIRSCQQSTTVSNS